LRRGGQGDLPTSVERGQSKAEIEEFACHVGRKDFLEGLGAFPGKRPPRTKYQNSRSKGDEKEQRLHVLR
jgi:hypothetical protein